MYLYIFRIIKILYAHLLKILLNLIWNVKKLCIKIIARHDKICGKWSLKYDKNIIYRNNNKYVIAEAHQVCIYLCVSLKLLLQ